MNVCMHEWMYVCVYVYVCVCVCVCVCMHAVPKAEDAMLSAWSVATCTHYTDLQRVDEASDVWKNKTSEHAALFELIHTQLYAADIKLATVCDCNGMLPCVYGC